MHPAKRAFDHCAGRLALISAIFLVRNVTGAVVPASTSFEVRLSVPTGSRISRPGDTVTAAVISPVFVRGQLLIPQGSIASGTVEEVGRLGFGVKHVTSDMRYSFDRLQLPDGTDVPIRATVMQVETAKERVAADGLVGGIYPTANLSSSLAPYVVPLLWIDPHFGLPFLGVKVVIARSPDPEIYFPATTEFVLRLTEDAIIPHAGAPAHAIGKLSPSDMADTRRILAKLPQQRTNQGRNHPSDLVNILFLGNRESINNAFHAAGWTGAQRSSLLSIYRMYHCMVQRMGYSMAPMGKLTLNGLRADAEYQKSLDTFSKRHHVRLWKQGHDEAWLSSATEDVGYRLRNMHLTHATDPVIDNERNKVLNDFAFTGCVEAAALIPRAMAEERETSFRTDGRIAVLRLNNCKQPRNPLGDGTGPGVRPRPRSVQALVALRNDLIRTNPAFLAYNTIKVLCIHRQSRASDSGVSFTGRSRTTRRSDPKLQADWIRPSVLDAEPQVN